MLCYEFTFIIQIVRPLSCWFLVISLDSDIQHDGSGKMLWAKLDSCTLWQEIYTNSDDEQFWIVEQATGLHEADIGGRPQLQLQHHSNQWRLHNQMFSLHPINILILCRGFYFYIHRLLSYPHRWVYSRWCWPINHPFGKHRGQYYRVFTVDTGLIQPWEGETANDS